MKKIIIGLFLLVMATLGHAQRDSLLTTQLARTYYVLDLPVLKAKIMRFVEQEQVDVLHLNESGDKLKLKFNLTKSAYDKFLRVSEDWKPVGYQNLVSQNLLARIQSLTAEKAYQEEKRAQYVALLKDYSKAHHDYLSLWREQRKIDEKIHAKQKEINSLAEQHKRFEVELTVVEEKNPTEYARFSLVNMPGIEYAWLTLETPLENFSAKTYHGLFLKYMFTRGKTYGLLGAFKDIENNKPDGQLDELFVFALGQDFYSRYLGRGARKSLNLYSSFNLGYIMATSDEAKWNSWYMSAFVGIELFKTKYILLDNKIGYFIPFKDNRNMRGLSYRASFNFVF